MAISYEHMLRYLKWSRSIKKKGLVDSLNENLAYYIYETGKYRDYNKDILEYVYKAVVERLKLRHYGVKESFIYLRWYEESGNYVKGRSIRITEGEELTTEHLGDFIYYTLEETIKNLIKLADKGSHDKWSGDKIIFYQEVIEGVLLLRNLTGDLYKEEEYKKLKKDLLKLMYKTLDDLDDKGIDINVYHLIIKEYTLTNIVNLEESG